jgi:hypothetical protein
VRDLWVRFSASCLQRRERGRDTYLSKFGRFSTAVVLAFQAGVPLCGPVEAPPTIRAYTPTPNMTIQLIASFTSTTTSGSGATANTTVQPHQHSSRHARAKPELCTSARRQAPISPLGRFALSPGPCREGRQWQRRRGYERVCRAQTPLPSCAQPWSLRALPAPRSSWRPSQLLCR